VRVRVVGERGYLTIKGKTEGISRQEFEYVIPLEDAALMLENLCKKPLIEKIRHRICLENLTWEVDEFLGDNQGLIMAEIELEQEEQVITIPDWIGQEVTGDERYYNSNLQKLPYKMW
jgi:CYTH domain-containing protein